MRSRPRIRRISKWTGIVASAIILTAWVVSLRYDFYSFIGEQSSIGGLGLYIEFKSNVLVIGRWDDSPRFPIEILSGMHPWHAPSFESFPIFQDPGTSIAIPFWLAFAFSAAPTMLLVYFDRKRNLTGHCPHCGYNLTGNTSGICSECGTKRPAENAPAKSD